MLPALHERLDGAKSLGVFAVPATTLQVWGWYGREYGILGLPSGAPSANPATGNYSQQFQGGVITVTAGVGAVSSASDPWVGTILSSSWLGAPTGSKSCALANGHCYQPYQNGWVVQGPAGVHAVPNIVREVWGWYGREFGPLGFPAGAPSAAPATGNYSQKFQGGTITVTGGVALAAVTDPISSVILSSPWLGNATGSKSCTMKGGACYVPFANGWVVQGPPGVFAVPNPVRTGWGWYGREYDVFGFPTGAPSANPTTGNYAQSFQGGLITVTKRNPSATPY